MFITVHSTKYFFLYYSWIVGLDYGDIFDIIKRKKNTKASIFLDARNTDIKQMHRKFSSNYCHFLSISALQDNKVELGHYQRKQRKNKNCTKLCTNGLSSARILRDINAIQSASQNYFEWAYLRLDPIWMQPAKIILHLVGLLNQLMFELKKL